MRSSDSGPRAARGIILYIGLDEAKAEMDGIYAMLERAPVAPESGAALAAEGAVAWIEPTVGLAEVAETIRDVCGGHVPHHARVDPAAAPLTTLTDRELQVLTLYVASRGHSPAHIGRILALRTSTIRSHLERGRARYRAAGLPTNNRAALRAALEADGWTLPAHVWIEAGRP